MGKRTKKHKVLKIFLWLFLILIVLLVITAIVFVEIKLGKITIKGLDLSKLGINNNLYNEISDKVSKKDFDSVTNILLIGTDSENGYDKLPKSDAIIILSINRAKKSIKLISIPRDTAVDIPNYKRFKLNMSYALGGEELLLQMINENFDLNLQEYVTVDFEGLVDIINKIGGIEMDISLEERNYINMGLSKIYKLSGNNYQSLKSYGKVTLNGEQAMVHARNRTVGNDFTRAERHRDVLQAIFNKIGTLSAKEILDLSDYLLDDVKTNVDINKYLVKFALELIYKDKYLANFTSTMVPSLEYSKGGLDKNGAYLVETDIEKAKADFIKYMYEM